MTDIKPLLSARRVTKAFGGALALDNVDLTVLPGEVHGLLGENGSASRPSSKFWRDTDSPEGGELAVEWARHRPTLPPGQSRALGFEFVHQDLGLVPSMTVAENLFMRDIAAPNEPGVPLVVTQESPGGASLRALRPGHGSRGNRSRCPPGGARPAGDRAGS